MATYRQTFFRTYADEYGYCFRIIHKIQMASKNRPTLFPSIIALLTSATLNKHHTLLTILPTLTRLLTSHNLPHLADELIMYARFVSDVSTDGRVYPKHGPPREEEEEEEEAAAEEEEEKERPYESEDTVCEEATPPSAAVVVEKPPPLLVVVQRKRDRKRKRPLSGILPQRKSVRQWNRIPAGESEGEVGRALIDER